MNRSIAAALAAWLMASAAGAHAANVPASDGQMPSLPKVPTYQTTAQPTAVPRTVDAKKVRHTAAMRRQLRRDRDTEALNLLSGAGYTGLTDFRADGLVFIAKAQHDGKPVTVMVDPGTKVIEPIG
jgi:hypothetical protein